MARVDSPPFERGQTWYNGGTIDSNNLGGLQHEGKEWVFEDIDLYNSAKTGAKPARTNRFVRCRVVRNVSGINLLPKRLVRFQKSGVNYGARVDGYTATTAERGYPVDEYLPAAGVVNNDLFWIVVDGPAMILMPIAPGDIANMTEGDPLVALTAATSQATTAGRITNQTFTGSTQTSDYTFLANQVENYIGRALSARTTGNTDSAGVLVEVGHW